MNLRSSLETNEFLLCQGTKTELQLVLSILGFATTCFGALLRTPWSKTKHPKMECFVSYSLLLQSLKKTKSRLLFLEYCTLAKLHLSRFYKFNKTLLSM